MLIQGISNIEPDNFWQMLPHEKRLLQKKRGVSRLVYILLLKWFEKIASFPESIESIPLDLIEYGIGLSGESIIYDELLTFLKQERTINRYKQEIREYFGFKIFNKDCPLLHEFLANNIFKEKNEETLKFKIYKYLKDTKIEIPNESTLLEVIKKSRKNKEQQIFFQIDSLLSEKDKSYIDNYLLESNDFDGVCQFLRQDSSASTREGVADEIKQFEILNQLPLKSLEFICTINTKQRNNYRRRFLTDTPERTKRRTNITRYSLAAIFCFQRQQEAIDNLVDHLLHFIYQIKKALDRKQESLNKEISQQLGDLDSLYLLAEINRDYPTSIIEQVVYPSVSQNTIDRLIKTRDFARQIKRKVRSSVIKRYSTAYRHIIFIILNCLNLQSNNVEFLEAIKLIKQYQKSKLKYYPIEVAIPIDKLISKQQQKEVTEKDEANNLRILRKDYECVIFKLLRLKLKHKEVWVSGALKYRDPIDDLPKDFEEKRREYYALLDAPLLAKDFIEIIKDKMSQNIKNFDDGLFKNELVNIVKKKGKPWIKLTPLEKAEEPKFLQRLKEAVLAKWGVIDLLDVLKEVDLRENFTNCFSTVGNRKVLDSETIRKRLLLCKFAIGTNAGLKRTSGASKGTVTFEELRHIRKFYLNKDDLREAINIVVNAIFRIRNPRIWKSVSTACAADSKQFGCFSKNLLTEWSPRHHNSGVMIYWHVSDQYICVYSQMKTCTSSEVASMLQGIMDQETKMEIESQYVDSHGQSELGFALSYLEKFDLLPRYKTIGNQKLYLPTDDFQVKNIKDISTRAIKWELIEDQYDEMIKYAVALKIGTATAETIIRTFSKSNYQHPTFKAFLELGKAIKTVFLCLYLHSVELRQQINAGLNVVENWNSANDFIYYGKSGDFTSNSREDQEISMLCLHLLQTSISYVNTLLIEEILHDEYWLNLLGEEDYRALTALFYLHINPYGSFEVDLAKRLKIKQVSV
jgi:TnpA family transposase